MQGVNTPRPSQNFTGIGGVCPPGAYCPEESPEPIGCPTGRFSNVSQLQRPTECTLCSDGHFCEQTNLTEPTGVINVLSFCNILRTRIMSVPINDNVTLYIYKVLYIL